MIFWAAVSAAMVVVAVVVYLNPEATVELLGGRVRSGLAMAGAFALPPVIFVVSVVMIARRKQRWRVRGGGVLTNPIVVGVDAGFPTAPLVSAVWIDEEPVRVDRLVDLKRLDAVALRASATAPAGQGNGR